MERAVDSALDDLTAFQPHVPVHLEEIGEITCIPSLVSNMTEITASKNYSIGGSGSAEGGHPQGLLKKKPTLSKEEFHAGWLEHARFGLPWTMDCGITHYVQNLNPKVADPTKMPAGVDLSDFDVAVEIRIPEEAPGTEQEKAVRAAYFEQEIVPDECRYFAGPNRDLAVWVPPGTIRGDRVDVLINGDWIKDENGKPVLDLEQSTKDYESWKKAYESGMLQN